MNMKIPVKAMNEEGEDGKPVMPAVGDEVMLPDVMAVVTAIDGDSMQVKVKSVGGCDCEEHGSEDMGKEEPTEESVMKMAKEADGE